MLYPGYHLDDLVTPVGERIGREVRENNYLLPSRLRNGRSLYLLTNVKGRGGRRVISALELVYLDGQYHRAVLHRPVKGSRGIYYQEEPVGFIGNLPASRLGTNYYRMDSTIKYNPEDDLASFAFNSMEVVEIIDIEQDKRKFSENSSHLIRMKGDDGSYFNVVQAYLTRRFEDVVGPFKDKMLGANIQLGGGGFFLTEDPTNIGKEFRIANWGDSRMSEERYLG